MGWPELLQALEAEAGREAQALLGRARAEAGQVVAQAREAAAALRSARLEREAAAAGRTRRAALAALGEARTRERLLLEQALLEEVRQAAAAQAAEEADGPLLARLLGEVLLAAPAGPLLLVVDPGDEPAARALLAAGHAGDAPRVAIEAAPARRGGVLLRAGPITLDDTLPARLDRAAALLGPALAQALLEDGG